MTRRVAIAGGGHCPGCGQASIPRPVVVELSPRPVPTEGRVLFVLTLPDSDPADGDVGELYEAACAVAEAAAPGRADVVILDAGVTLDMLPDDQLAAAGLQRNPGQAR